MGSTTPAKPQPSLQVPGSPPSGTQSHRSRPRSEFDPFANAKITSPFYLYNHDSPRPSYDCKSPPDIHISVTDLEAGSTLSPSITSEKHPSQAQDSGRIRLWGRGQGRCMTRPRQSWFKQLPNWQRLLIKILIALLLIGFIVGVAVGISIHVHGGIWKSSNQTSAIGR